VGSMAGVDGTRQRAAASQLIAEPIAAAFASFRPEVLTHGQETRIHDTDTP